MKVLKVEICFISRSKKYFKMFPKRNRASFSHFYALAYICSASVFNETSLIQFRKVERGKFLVGIPLL